MAPTDEKHAFRREMMIAEQLRQRGIHDERVLAAMAAVPRERFLPADRQDAAYEDGAQPIGDGQTISQPYIVALMTQELDPHPTHRVLEIGVGSGYQTAVLARLVKHVYGVERLGDLADRARRTLAAMDIANVTLSVGDGTLGLPAEAPFDRILAAAAGPDIPPSWIDQLAPGGRIVAPVGERSTQELIRMDMHGDRLTKTKICDVRFVPLIGKQGWA
jgi:protein-L-isoaspartate(D-aspartate) O-methyltransferase